MAGGFRVFNDDTKLHRLFHSGFISFTAIIMFIILSFVLVVCLIDPSIWDKGPDLSHVYI